jgi:hypothetical protein
VTTPETSAVEPDDVEPDEAEPDEAELDEAELAGVELVDAELAGAELDGSAEDVVAGRTPHEALTRTMLTAGRSQLTRGPSHRVVVVTQIWTV